MHWSGCRPCLAWVQPHGSIWPPASPTCARGIFLEDDEILLQRAVERLVRFGKQVGMSPEEMISLLDSGISVPGLLAFLERKASEHA